MDTMTKADPRAIVDALLRQAQLEWEMGREEVDEKRRRMIVAALKAGATLKQVSQATGLSISRVSQIRDDTR